MVVGEPKVQQDRPHYRMDEGDFLVAFVGEVAQEFHALGKLLRRWGQMDWVSLIAVEDGHARFARLL